MRERVGRVQGHAAAATGACGWKGRAQQGAGWECRQASGRAAAAGSGSTLEGTGAWSAHAPRAGCRQPLCNRQVGTNAHRAGVGAGVGGVRGVVAAVSGVGAERARHRWSDVAAPAPLWRRMSASSGAGGSTMPHHFLSQMQAAKPPCLASVRPSRPVCTHWVQTWHSRVPAGHRLVNKAAQVAELAAVGRQGLQGRKNRNNLGRGLRKRVGEMA